MSEKLDIILTNLRASRRKLQFIVDGCLLEDVADGIFFMHEIINGRYDIDNISCKYASDRSIVRILIDLK